MASPDILALKNSDLNAFLYSDVGTEVNGSQLTILSLLARLGTDPWAEAGRLAALPRTAATDWLSERIAQMPLTAQALAEARATALKLVPLLPSRTWKPAETVGAPVAPAKPSWLMVALVAGVLALGLAVSATHWSAPVPSPDTTLQGDR